MASSVFLAWLAATLACSQVAPTRGHDFGALDGPDGWVDDHNYFRSLHGAGDVAWDEDLAEKAQNWAHKLEEVDSMFHSDSYGTWPPSGENLAWGYGGCSAATSDGGPKLYGGDYDQHCAVASWYGEYYLWRGEGSWSDVEGIGHFTAMVWKGIDSIGCASAGKFHVCEYGSTKCKERDSYGGQRCWGPTPSHLPNFNMNQCSGNGECVQAASAEATGLYDASAGGDPGAPLRSAPRPSTAPLVSVAVGFCLLLVVGGGALALAVRSRHAREYSSVPDVERTLE